MPRGKSRGYFHKLRRFHQLDQTEYRPRFLAAAIGPGQVAVATQDRRRPLLDKLGLREPPKSHHFVHHETRRKVAMIGDKNAGQAIRDRGCAAEITLEVENRDQLAAHVGETRHPAARARYSRYCRRISKDLARLVSRRNKFLTTEAKRDSHFFRIRRDSGTMTGGGSAAATLEFEQQLEGLVDQAAQSFRLHRLIIPPTPGVYRRPGRLLRPASPGRRPRPGACPISGPWFHPWSSPSRRGWPRLPDCATARGWPGTR